MRFLRFLCDIGHPVKVFIVDLFEMLSQVRLHSKTFFAYLTKVVLDFMMNHFNMASELGRHIESF